MDVAVSFNPKVYDPCTYSKMYQEVVVTACISLQHAYELENAIALYASGKLFCFFFFAPYTTLLVSTHAPISDLPNFVYIS